MIDNAPQVVDSGQQEEVPSLMIPLAGRVLLVPTVTVAEMAPYSAPEPQADSPDWFLGYYHWRELRVPLLSFEVLNGDALPSPASRSRVAVFNNTGVSDELPFIAVATQGIPKLARVSPDEISEVEGSQKQAFDLMRVNLAGEEAVIPNVTALEKVYLDWAK